MVSVDLSSSLVNGSGAQTKPSHSITDCDSTSQKRVRSQIIEGVLIAHPEKVWTLSHGDGDGGGGGGQESDCDNDVMIKMK